MVQAAVTKRTMKGKPSGTLGGGKNGTQAKPEKELPGMHVKSAKKLREEYVELQNSPDGMEPDPLTVPKVVECGHCGWPVYPRECKVATKKTFARAGITRGTRKEEEAQKAEMGIIEDDDEDAGSNDSRNTEERLRDELEDLQEKCEELEKENVDLKEEKEELEKQVVELKATIEEQFDRIEFLEELEQKWRDKVDQAELRIDELKLFLDRAGMVSADRERGLVCALEEIASLREQLAAFKRRRILMLLNLEQKLHKKEKEDYMAITFRLWRTHAVGDKLTREAEDAELCRERDVSDMQAQVSVERLRVAALKANELRLKGRLRAAGQRFLARAISDQCQPVSKAHALRVWNGTTPLLHTEKVLEETRRQLEASRMKMEELQQRNYYLEMEYARVKEERDALEAENADLKDQVEFLKLEGGGGKSRDVESRRQERKKELADLKRALDQALADLESERKAWKEEKALFQQEIESLESRLEVAEAAAMAGYGNGVPEVDEASRICPKGQGVLCVGCLKQLVHRGVRPLPPVQKLPASAADRLDKAKEKFFEQELRGAPMVEDSVHTYQWRARKDPYGIARLTVWPRRSQTKGTANADSRPSSPSASAEDTLASPTPKTGLPALKKAKKLRGEGVVSPLKMSMRDFKPSGFR